MQILWALVFLAVMVSSCAWAWRRTRAALALRGWRLVPSHCVGAAAGAFAAVVALLAVAMVAAPGIDLIGRLLVLPILAAMHWGFWRLTTVDLSKRLGPTAAARGAAGPRVPPAPRASLSGERSQGPEAKNTFAFIYRKPDGSESRRTVRVERHGFDGSSKYVEGHCSNAGASRSFRLDRVQGRVTDMETGELISAGEMYRRLGDPSKSLEVNSFSAAARAPVPTRRPGWQTAVYFAGFGANQYAELVELAETADMDVRTSISRTVDYVVKGNLAGRQQVAQAEAHGIAVIDEDAFRALI
ncbi:hypothetical protein [uncultured Variovorax sp.]|uniref:WYL domain-containing protein n=1 Tax=uncultured Variovorax sp. TaxID=114708 RepID=UPI0025F8AF89|nr:hypothetical protein [uncultured Variovorax sp.]